MGVAGRPGLRGAAILGLLIGGAGIGERGASADSESDRRIYDLLGACDAEPEGEADDGSYGPTRMLEGDPAGMLTDGEGRLLYNFHPEASAEQGRVRLDAGRKMRAVAMPSLEERAALLAARDRLELRAMIHFRLRAQEGLPRPCTAVGGGRFVHVRVAPLWVELIPLVGGRPGKAVRALTQEGALEPAAGAVPRADLRVTVAKAAPGESDAIQRAAMPLRERAVPCFRPVADAIRRGTVAIELSVGAAGGPATDPRVMLDGVHVPQVTECLMRAMRLLRFPKSERGAEVMVAVEYSLAPAPSP